MKNFHLSIMRSFMYYFLKNAECPRATEAYRGSVGDSPISRNFDTRWKSSQSQAVTALARK
jgi:hypothetical protein